MFLNIDVILQLLIKYEDLNSKTVFPKIHCFRGHSPGVIKCVCCQTNCGKCAVRLQVLVNALLSSGGGGEGEVVTDRRAEGRSFCEASLFNKERIRHGQFLGVRTGFSGPTKLTGIETLA